MEGNGSEAEKNLFRNDHIAGICRIWCELPRRSFIVLIYFFAAVDCFWNTINDSLSSGDFTVTAGYEGTTFQQFRTVAKIFTDDYNMRNGSRVHVNNVALLKLKERFDFNGNVNAVCVTPRFRNKMYRNKNDPPGKVCVGNVNKCVVIIFFF